MIALDASALLAFLFREAGHEAVAAELGDSCLSTVNLSEVVARFVRDGHAPGLVVERITASPVVIVPFSSTEALLAASFVPHTRHLGLSVGARACLALGAARQIPVLTADRTWRHVDCGVTVRLNR